MNPIMSDVPVFWATVRAFARAELQAKLQGLRPGQPQPTTVLDQNPLSPTFLQQIPVDPGSYITSTVNGNTPVTVAGRVCLAAPERAAESCVAGTHTISTPAEIEAELARQAARLAAARAEDARLRDGKAKFEVSLPGQGSK